MLAVFLFALKVVYKIKKSNDFFNVFYFFYE
nr:MAG TPA: hypothetical protein [Caudoviricetes sp.]